MTFQSRWTSANNDRNLLCALLLIVPLLFASACGGGSSIGGGGNSSSNPTITSVSVGCSPTSILTTQTSTCSATVTGTGSYSSAVNWTATGGTITSAGVFTPSGAGTATIAATSTQDTTKSGSATVTVTVTVSPAITSVSVACSPTSILTTQTSTCSATVQGTGSYSSGVNWTATGGTITSAGVFTPSGAGTATITATSTQDTTKSGTATVTVTVPPTITSVSVACSPTSILTTQTSACSATVTGTASYSSAVAWSVSPNSIGTVSASGVFAPSSAGTATITATSTQDSTKSGSASITVVVQSSGTLSISPGSATVALGGSTPFTLTTTGSPTPAVSCSVNGAGSVQVVGSTATYSVPLPLPASFSATLNCTATNTTGSASASSQIALQYPVPVLTSVSPSAIDLLGLTMFPVSVQLKGVGFYPGGIVDFGAAGDSAPMPQGVDPETTNWAIKMLANDPPGWLDITLSTPAGGPGGGTSNTIYLAYMRPYNSLVVAGNNGYQLLPGSGTIQYSLPSGTEITTGGGTVDPNGIAVDENTGNVLESTLANLSTDVSVSNSSLNFFGGVEASDGSPVGAVAAGSGYGCISIPGDGALSMFPFIFPAAGPSQITTPPGPKTGSSPGPISMTTINGQPTCIVYDLTDQTISEVQVAETLAVPSMQLLRTFQLSNLITYSQAVNSSNTPGWQLVAFKSGPALGTAALLSEADNQLVFVDLNKGQEIRRVTISGLPFNLAVDNTNGLVVVAVANLTTGVSQFERVDPASGTVTPIQTTSTLLATGIAVSNDGSSLFVANNSQFQTIALPLPSPTVSITVSPSPVSVNLGTVQQFTASVNGTFNSNVTWSVNGVQGGNSNVGLINSSGLYAAPPILPSPATITIQATSVQSPTASGSASVILVANTAGSPAVSIVPASIAVALGSSTTFTFNASGSGISTSGCNVTGPGSVVLSGSQATYTAPSNKPSSFFATVTCAATNSAGSGSATIAVSLQYPVPSIEAVSPAVVECARECTVTFSLQGSGFYPGGILHIAPLGDIQVPSNATPTQFSGAITFQQFAYGSNFSPGWLDFSVSNPTDNPGGGQSNVLSTAFLSAFNTAFRETPNFGAASVPNYWQFDATGGWGVGPFANGNGQGAITFFVSQSPIYDVATEDTSWGLPLGTELTGVYAEPYGGGGLLSIDKPLGIDQLNKIACVSQDQDKQVSGIDLSNSTLPVTSTPLGKVPWAVTMTSLSANETDCVVFDAGNLDLSVLTMPSLVVKNSTTLSGLTPITQAGASPVGGWQLAVFNSGPAAGTAAVLSQTDDVVVFVNLSTGQEIRRVTLSGLAIRIAPDNTHGALIVAIADSDSRQTTFQTIGVSTGAVATLQATSPLLATGLGVSQDGSNLFVGMRLQYAVMPNK
jgi:hypothetical protein